MFKIENEKQAMHPLHKDKSSHHHRQPLGIISLPKGVRGRRLLELSLHPRSRAAFLESSCLAVKTDGGCNTLSAVKACAVTQAIQFLPVDWASRSHSVSTAHLACRARCSVLNAEKKRMGTSTILHSVQQQECSQDHVL